MNSVIVLFLGLIAFSGGQNTTVQGAFGIASSVKANTPTTISFGIGGFGPSLDILVSQDTTVTVSVFLSTSLNTVGTFPSGYGALGFSLQGLLSAAAGFSVTLGNGAVLISANLSTGGLDAAAQAALNASGRAGCLEYSASANAFSDIAISSISVSKGITIPIPESGVYIFAGVNLNAATPNFFGRIKKLLANARAIVSFAANFTSNIVVDVTANANADLNVTFSSNNPAPKSPPSTWVPLQVYWDITVSGGASVNAVLNFTYTDAQLKAAGVAAANTLKFAFYNTATAAWEFVTGASVDVNAKVVSQTTAHFSTWGVFSDTGATQGTGTSQGQGTNSTADAAGILASVFLLLSCLFAFL